MTHLKRVAIAEKRGVAKWEVYLCSRATHLMASQQGRKQIEQVDRDLYLGMTEDLLMIPKVAWVGTQACENPVVEHLLVNGMNHFSAVMFLH